MRFGEVWLNNADWQGRGGGGNIQYSTFQTTSVPTSRPFMVCAVTEDTSSGHSSTRSLVGPRADGPAPFRYIVLMLSLCENDWYC